MLPKTHLILQPRMSDARWVITPSWIFGSWRSFLHSSSGLFCHVLLISSPPVRSMPFVRGLFQHANAKGTHHLLHGCSQRWTHVWTKFSFLHQSFWPPWPFCNCFRIRTTDLIFWIIHFQGICDPCYYYLLLLRPQGWKDLALLGVKKYKSTFGSKVKVLFQELLSDYRSLFWLPASGVSNLKMSLCHGSASQICG